jgi:hypothetical protein
MSQGNLTGSAGVYYVAARLNAEGFHGAPTFGNVPDVDLLVSAREGSGSAALQVKTAMDARRMRGGKLHHYEWAMNCSKALRLEKADILFALVDLKGFLELPDIFFVPSKVIASYYRRGVKDWYGGDPAKWKWPRYHEEVENLDRYRNNWNVLEEVLKLKESK